MGPVRMDLRVTIRGIRWLEMGISRRVGMAVFSSSIHVEVSYFVAFYVLVNSFF
jgi:hypothetical protein